MKLYERAFAQISYSEEWFNGLRFRLSGSYERRKPLINNTDYVLINDKDDIFSSNNPFDRNDFESKPFSVHNIFNFRVDATISLGQRYFSYPRSKFNIRNPKFPSIQLTYKGGIGASVSDYNYSMLMGRLSQGFDIGNKGYFRYNFWDTESTKLPYQVGTYLGKKKVFGVGAGFFSHPNGMYNETTGSHSHVNHFALDAFLDRPIPSGALNVYTSFIAFDYGENYVSRWAGTGKAVYAQLGYYSNRFKLMPYIAFQSGNYDGFEEPVRAMDIGLNYFINGHNAKLTLEYHRIKGDIREAAITAQDDALSQIRLQMHIFL